MKLIIFFDGGCPFCITSARFISRMDWFRQIDLVDLHQWEILDEYEIDPEKAQQRIQVRTKSGRVLEGLHGITYASKFLPLIWPFIPLMKISLWIGLGEKVYDWIAKHRLIFPVPGFCPIDSRKDPESPDKHGGIGLLPIRKSPH